MNVFSVLFCIYLVVELLSDIINCMFSFLRNYQAMFFIVAESFYIHTNNV